MSSKANRCVRCNRRLRSAAGWNVIFSKGTPTAILCPTCQTPEENAEAEIREATTDYTGSWVDGCGRWHFGPQEDRA